jgi:hypothetical protein
MPKPEMPQIGGSRDSRERSSTTQMKVERGTAPGKAHCNFYLAEGFSEFLGP